MQVLYNSIEQWFTSRLERLDHLLPSTPPTALLRSCQLLRKRLYETCLVATGKKTDKLRKRMKEGDSDDEEQDDDADEKKEENEGKGSLFEVKALDLYIVEMKLFLQVLFLVFLTFFFLNILFLRRSRE